MVTCCHGYMTSSGPVVVVVLVVAENICNAKTVLFESGTANSVHC